MGQSISREALIDELNAIEERYDVTQWKLGDLHYWPVLKNVIFFSWHQQFLHQLSIQKKAKPGSRSKILNKERLLKQIISFYSFKFFGPSKKIDFLFAGTDAHRVVFKQTFLNRYFDPLINDFKVNACFVEYGKIVSNTSVSYPHYPNFLHLKQFKVLKASSISDINNQINRNHDLKKAIEYLSKVIDVKSQTTIRKLANRIDAIRGNAKIFEAIFKKYQPKIAFGLYYYGDEIYGMNLAAHRLKIPTVDMQHGGVGIMHPSYTGFKRIPENGYSILPNFFWCWDAITAEAVSTKNNFSAKHRVVNGGNPWYIYALNKGDGTAYQITETKPVILYTLQYSVLDTYIVEAIRATKEDFVWYIRMHPRMMHEKHLIESTIKNERLTNINIDDASRFPLPLLMVQSQLHISKFSGSINEAYELGLPNIVIGEIGYQQFKPLIETGELGYFSTTDTSDRLVNLIAEYSNKNKRSFDISRYKQKILNNFQSIIEADV